MTATIGDRPATVQFAGLSPGFVGLYQVNVMVPSGLAPSSSVPLVINTRCPEVSVADPGQVRGRDGEVAGDLQPATQGMKARAFVDGQRQIAQRVDAATVELGEVIGLYHAACAPTGLARSEKLQ